MKRQNDPRIAHKLFTEDECIDYDLCTIRELAAEFGVHKATAWRWAKMRRFPRSVGWKHCGDRGHRRAVLWKRYEVQAFIEEYEW